MTSTAHAVDFAKSGPNPCAWRIAAPAASPADGAEVEPPCDERGLLRRLRPALFAKYVAGPTRARVLLKPEHVRHYPAGDPGQMSRNG